MSNDEEPTSPDYSLVQPNDVKDRQLDWTGRADNHHYVKRTSRALAR